MSTELLDPQETRPESREAGASDGDIPDNAILAAKRRARRRKRVRSVLSHAALMSLSIVFMIPFAWLVLTSLKSESHMNTFPPEWIPRGRYVEIAPDQWAEVIREEVIEYSPDEYDAAGNLKPRIKIRSKVDLVDAFGRPPMTPDTEMIFDVDAFNAMVNEARERGTFHNLSANTSESILETIDQHGAIRRVLLSRTFVDRLIPRIQATPSMIVPSNTIVDRERATLRHYFTGLSSFSFDLFLQNTLFIALISVVGSVLSCSWIAYGFSILEWPGRDKLFWLMLATMMLPGQVTMIPLFLIFKHLGWINTYLPLLVPMFLGNAFFIFLLRQFFLTIPRELIDAARVDGCSAFRIYWQIVMPLSTPALATVALFTFLLSWNDFMGPLVYIVDEAKYTLSLGLAMFRGRFMTRYGELMAVSTLMTIPIIVLFFFTQKTFIQGIKTSGMKN